MVQNAHRRCRATREKRSKFVFRTLLPGFDAANALRRHFRAPQERPRIGLSAFGGASWGVQALPGALLGRPWRVLGRSWAVLDAFVADRRTTLIASNRPRSLQNRFSVVFGVDFSSCACDLGSLCLTFSTDVSSMFALSSALCLVLLRSHHPT